MESELDQSVYSYYTERTDLNESVMGIGDTSFSPDKNAKGMNSVEPPRILADLETCLPPKPTLPPTAVLDVDDATASSNHRASAQNYRI